jgi:hypothetical protein
MKNLIEGPLAFCVLTNLGYQSMDIYSKCIVIGSADLYTCIITGEAEAGAGEMPSRGLLIVAQMYKMRYPC